MNSARMKNTGRFGAQRPAEPAEISVNTIKKLLRVMDRDANVAVPVRPQGAATAATDCNQSAAGTVVRMTELDRILHIDPENLTVTAQAGIRLYALAEALAEQRLQLIGNHDMMGRTLGGAIAAPSLGAGIGNESGSLASHVISVKMVSGAGQPMTVDNKQPKLLGAMRASYGLLGVIVEATLKVQPIATFSATHRRLRIDEFSSIVDTLTNNEVGIRFCMMPYRDRVYLDLRRYAADAGNAYNTPWRIKDWGESTVMPHVCKSLNILLPIQSVRYRLIDSVTEATQGIINSRFVRSGSNASAQSRTASRARRVLYSTWCFPATDFSFVLKAYQKFCRETYERTHYRCDLPAIGYRVCKDSSAALSPAFDEPMIALQTTSMQRKGWEDFAIDLADFAENWAGVPIFSQTRSLRADYAKQVFAERLEFFRRIRRQLDPEDRLLTPFMAQYFN
ncbi:MAG: FAD-binding oxidoreductase [Gammaproteobacteria bacterium]|nr:FAD-binding oxidoreductase [Gammaproteobacteria bacterium]